MRNGLRFTILVSLIVPALLMAQPTLDITEFATGLTRPIDIDNIGDDRLFITEQAGIIRILDNMGNVAATPFMDITDRVLDAANEQGLLGLAFPPDFETSQVFYVNYTWGSGSGRTRVSRFSVNDVDPNKGDPDSEEVLLDYNQTSDNGNHNGGDLNFGPDGYLYVGSGDGGGAGDPDNQAQNKTLLLGKLLRIDVSPATGYNIPVDNPYAGHATFAEEIWAVGMRNPWRFSFDSKTGDMWIGDVGQQAREEVDFEPAGSAGGINYGWRCFEGAQAYLNIGCNDSYTYPIFTYPHNNSTGGYSITGGYVYRGMEHPYLDGNYIFCDYISGNFWMTSVEDGTGDFQTFRQNGLRSGISTFGEDANGEIYAGRLTAGIIYKIGALCPDIAFTTTITEEGDSLVSDRTTGTFQWFLDGNPIPNANDYFYTPTEDGDYILEVIINDDGCVYESTSNTVVFMLPTGIAMESFKQLEIFPNPVKDMLHINLDQIRVDKIESWELTNIEGKDFQIIPDIQHEKILIDVKELPHGFYYIRLVTADDNFIGKFLVQ